MMDIHTERELTKINLSSFLDDLILSHLDTTTDYLVKKLNKELLENYNEVYEDYSQNYAYDFEKINFIEEQLISIIEMKIIHLYKGVEINTKKLIKASFSANTTEMYKWEYITSFLDAKNINYKEIPGFDEVNELRIVNNHLKHWLKGEKNKINHIKEFSGQEINLTNLTKFYDRVKVFPLRWILGIRDSIYDNLYNFDEARLDILANQLALRMDYNTMTKYINKLKSRY